VRYAAEVGIMSFESGERLIEEHKCPVEAGKGKDMIHSRNFTKNQTLSTP
jgi:hypothetical protein